MSNLQKGHINSKSYSRFGSYYYAKELYKTNYELHLYEKNEIDGQIRTRKSEINKMINRWKAGFCFFSLFILFLIVVIPKGKKKLLFVLAVLSGMMIWSQTKSFRSFCLRSDNKLQKLEEKLKEEDDSLLICRNLILTKAITLADSAYEAETEKARISEKTRAEAEAKALRKFIEENSVCKELKIVCCSWQSKPDIPEYGDLSGASSLTGCALWGRNHGGGLARSRGHIAGQYVGRVYGEDYGFFHFILSDNSYHVIDAEENPKWRMAKEGMKVKYEKIYRDYNRYDEILTPIWVEK